MGKPVIVLVAGHLFLLAPIRFHPPDLHVARASRTEVNVSPIRSILGTIIESLCCRQPDLRSAARSNLVDVELAAAASRKHKELAVRRPPVHVRGPLGRDSKRLSAPNRNGIHD